MVLFDGSTHFLLWGCFLSKTWDLFILLGFGSRLVAASFFVTIASVLDLLRGELEKDLVVLVFFVVVDWLPPVVGKWLSGVVVGIAEMFSNTSGGCKLCQFMLFVKMTFLLLSIVIVGLVLSVFMPLLLGETVSTSCPA